MIEFVFRVTNVQGLKEARVDQIFYFLIPPKYMAVFSVCPLVYHIIVCVFSRQETLVIALSAVQLLKKYS